MTQTRLKKTTFLMSNFLIFGSQLGSQIRKLNSKNRFFSLSWANLGTKGVARHPKRAKMMPKGAPRERKWGQKAYQESQIDSPKCPKTSTTPSGCLQRHNFGVIFKKIHPWILSSKDVSHNLHITILSATRPSRNKPVTLQTQRSQEAPKRVSRQDFERFGAHFGRFLGIHFWFSSRFP